MEVFIKGQDAPLVIPYSDIKAIAFTGRDTADGKSWATWVAKKDTERAAEAERIRVELEAQGHLYLEGRTPSVPFLRRIASR